MRAVLFGADLTAQCEKDEFHLSAVKDGNTQRGVIMEKLKHIILCADLFMCPCC